MKHAKTYLPAAVLIGGLLALSASAQEAVVVPTPTGPTQEVDTPPAPGTPAHAAQLQREHKRAVAAGDHANDPLNSASSDALNKQEVAKAMALGNGPVPASTTTGSLPVNPDPATIPPPPDPPQAGNSLKPDTSTVQ